VQQGAAALYCSVGGSDEPLKLQKELSVALLTGYTKTGEPPSSGAGET